MVQGKLFGNCKGNWKNTQASSRMTLMALGKFQVTEGTFKKDFQRLTKHRQKHRVIQSQVEETWTLSTGYGNQVQTQQSHLSQCPSIWRLVNSFVMFRISTMGIYTLVCNYCIFLEWVRIRLCNHYLYKHLT